jgi:spore germination cell wall hydrolase CwlJ-like protein
MKKIIGVAVVFGVSVLIATVIVHAKDAQEYQIKTKMFGAVQGTFCVSEGNCVPIRKEEDLPISTEFPLGKTTFSNNAEVTCLAKNITQEAQGNQRDMILVAWATVNRVKYKYGKTICEVISASNYSSKHGKNIYQMSWYGDLAKRARPPSKKALTVASLVLSGQIPNPVPTCKITNWYNRKRDPKGTFNESCVMKRLACSISDTGANHMYIGVPYGKC